jgi:hypothetical protein
MFWKIVAIVSFVAGVLVGAIFLRSDPSGPVPPAGQRTPPTTCPSGGGGGPVDTSVV